MKSKKQLLTLLPFALCLLLIFCFPVLSGAQNYEDIQLIDVSNGIANLFNVDVVIDPSDGTLTNGQSTGTEIDGNSWAFVTDAEKLLHSGKKGIPDNGIINKDDWTIKFNAKWNGYNARRIYTGTGNWVSFGISSGVYSEIRLAATSGGGDTTEFDVILTYTDNSTKTQHFTLPDWDHSDQASNAYVLVEKLDFMETVDDHTYHGDNNKYIYYVKISPDTNKTLYLMKITNTKSNGSNKFITFFGGAGRRYKSPTITSFTPTKAKTGDIITITGENFINGSFKVNSVRIGGSDASFNVVSATQITASVGSTSGPITVTGVTGSATSSYNFTLDTSIPPISYTYYNASDQVVPENDDTAVRRVGTGGNKPDTTEYALIIRHDFSESANVWGYQESIGNPDPAVGKHWYMSGTVVNVKVNGIVQDINNINLRYVLSEYTTRLPNSFQRDSTSISQLSSIADQYMSTWRELSFIWHSQWAVQINVVPDSMKDNVSIYDHIAGASYGIGRSWAEDGARVSLYATEGCLPIEGYRDNLSYTDTSIKQGKAGLSGGKNQQVLEIESLKEPVSITWQYKSHEYEIEVTVGTPMSWYTIPLDVLNRINTEAAPTMPLDAASVQTGENLYYWSNTDKKAFPLIGDRWFQLEWQMKDGEACTVPVVTLIRAKWPLVEHYTHIANTPPVPLDPSPDDKIKFQELKYTDKNAKGEPIGKVTDTKFTASEKGKSVLLLTSDDPIEQQIPILSPRQVSLKFNGTSDYIEIKHNGRLYLNDWSAFTIEAWIKPAAIPSDRYSTIFDNGACYLGINAQNQLYFQYLYVGFSVSVKGGTIPVGQWTHVAAYLDTTNKKMGFYINGKKYLWDNSNPSMIKSDRDYVRIGSNVNSGNSFNGNIDEVRIWSVARLEADINTYMNKRLGDESLMSVGCGLSPVIGYWRIDEYGTTTLADSSYNKNDAPLGNMNAATAWTIDSSVVPQYQTMQMSTMVRVVQTNLWNDGLTTSTAVIGSEITSTLHSADVPHNGHVFSAYGENLKQLYPRYNAEIYNTQTMEGPIIPVNAKYTSDVEDNMVVVWYRVQEGISWPYTSVKYDCRWPSPASNKNRIVIASRQGSEGRNADGAYQMWLDSEGKSQNGFDPKRYSEIKVYNQPDKTKPGYNPNEEHALTAASFRHADMAPLPTAAFALRNDLNVTTQDANYTSDPYVLVQYFDNVTQKHAMSVFKVETEDSRYAYPEKVSDHKESYTFHYLMKAGEIVVAPYPVNVVIGAAPPAEISGQDGRPDVQKCYWEDHKGQPWAISGGSYLYSHFWYPLDSTFWCDGSDKCGGVKAPGDGTGNVGFSTPWLPEIVNGAVAKVTQQNITSKEFPLDMKDKAKAVKVQYDVVWPEEVPILKAGETDTFPGGEFRSENPTYPGLPAVLAWAAGQVVYDDLNPRMDTSYIFDNYLVRLVPVLLERTVPLAVSDYPEGLRPASGKVNVEKGQYYFKDLHAGLKKRIFYDPITGKLGIRGYVNDKTLGDKSLTEAPPSVYILQPNILTPDERDAIKALSANAKFGAAVDSLYNLTVNPSGFTGKGNTAGVELCCKAPSGNNDLTKGAPLMALGPGLAVIPSPKLGSPDPSYQFSEAYVTLAENNHPAMGALPVALHIVKVKNQKYRGAIKAVFSDNVFDEKITMRHTADFGANVGDQIFQWWYREEDGTNPAPPSIVPEKWRVFPGQSNEVVLAGAGAALLADNMFFVRYKHKDCVGDKCWSDWAGAANSRPPKPGEDPAITYNPQLAEGWVKRVVNGINPFEARINNFSADAPAAYVSMIQEAGPRYEGDVAFNPQKDVIENVGLIELYQTVLERAKDLSIDLSQPANTSGVVTALLLAASRINGLYTLLGNEAYTDAMDPTVGFGTSSLEYGSLAPTIFTFMNQVPTLLDEELSLLRGRDQEGARPFYNRLMWNFSKGDGEAAYAMSYNVKDENKDGFIDEADARIEYPQGHGDAWGHYLTAMKAYYTLLKHPYFNWETRAEKLYIEGATMDVDYLDERKFAETASAKAKVGAEIVNLTYRSQYVDDPAGQWQGYTDTDTDRAWGVSEWGERAFMGSLFDWAIANAILPPEDTDPTHTGVKKIDRTTVSELMEIAAQGREIQKQLDNANIGLNPLGLVADVVPFDIDPSRLNPMSPTAATHFEQVYERAVSAMENARIIFDYANDLKNRIRQVAVSAEEFADQVDKQDMDYRNRLIEVFGTPYEGLIGPGNIFPAGYEGPDYFCYNYIDVNEVSDKTLPEPSEKFTAFFKPMNRTFDRPDRTTLYSGKLVDLMMKPIGGDQFKVEDLTTAFKTYFPGDDTNATKSEVYTSTDSGILQVDMPMGPGDYAFQAPSDWGIRKSPGEIQTSLTEMVKAQTEFKIGMENYENFIDAIQYKFDTIEARKDLYDSEIYVDNMILQTKMTYQAGINAYKVGKAAFGYLKDKLKGETEASVEALPKSTGTSTDATAPARSAIRRGGIIATESLVPLEKAADKQTDYLETAISIVEGMQKTEVIHVEAQYDLQKQLKELQTMLNEESVKRLDVFRLKENLRQVGEKYRATLAKGLRLIEERKAFNMKSAAKVQAKRYQDMAFRLNANSAVSKYRAMFDVAARNVYLAAKAYDYETNLDDKDSASPKTLMADIIKQRTLGQYKDGHYIIGQGGLGDTMERLKANYAVLKGQMGFNNPQTETGRMSLRYELFRIKSSADQDTAWRGMLQKSKVENLWLIPEFKKYCRPFIAESAGAQPGLAIDFTTYIVSGRNFFGKFLGGGDHAYDSTNFATKVRSVGVWFDGYDNSLLAETPRAYLIPVGMDVMLVPNSNDMTTREWTITDQKIPVPLPVGKSDISKASWIPSLDSLDGSMIEIRRYSSFRAYHDSGYFDQNQMSYDSRLIGRSVWNSRWILIIPGATFHYDAKYGLDTFMNTVKDIKLFFQTYAISGN